MEQVLVATGSGQTLANTGGGGGHGGYGGSSLSNALGGAVMSDSITQPTGVGSRGGGGSQGLGGNGGGALELIVNGALQLDGRISADGVSTNSLNSGGGSGGSIWLKVGKLSGAGSVSANGGPANNIGGGGGGGRVAIWCNTNTFTGAVAARGGVGGNYGGAGTIYTVPNFNNQARGLIIVDNGGARGTNTPITSIPGAPSASDLLIGNGASVVLATTTLNWNSLIMGSNSALNIDPAVNSMNLTITSNMTIQAGASISMDARGFPANVGVGRGSGLLAPGASGASHGGNGSVGAQSNLVQVAYDSLTNPSYAR